jgi:KaiC/GvpD/RAD55 family RecA-like ATPase
VVRRVPTGIEALDVAMSGGFPAGSSILISGGPGSGKTIFAMTFLLNGAEKFREKGSYISFSESKDTMYENMKSLGMELQKLEDRRMFWYQEMFSATEEGMGGLLTQALDTIADNHVQRVVIDSISAITQAFSREYDARQIFHTVIEKLIRNLESTTLVISERSAETSVQPPFEEFVADGVVRLKTGLPRELEVWKLRGTKLTNRRFSFTIDHGFTVLETRIEYPDRPQRFKPIPPSGNMISSGNVDLDRVLGGGFPRGSYVVLEADTNVTLEELRLVTHSIMLNFLSQRQGLLILPTAGVDGKEIVGLLSPYLSEDDLKFLRVAEELTTEGMNTQESRIPPYVALMKGGRNNIDVDSYMFYDTLAELKKLTDNKPVLRVMGYDMMESKYSEIPEKLYNEIGLAIIRTRAAGDLTIGIARPNLAVLPKVLDMVDRHLKLWRTNRTVVFQGVKPPTQQFAVLCDYSEGYPRTKFVEMT